MTPAELNCAFLSGQASVPGTDPYDMLRAGLAGVLLEAGFADTTVESLMEQLRHHYRCPLYYLSNQPDPEPMEVVTEVIGVETQYSAVRVSPLHLPVLQEPDLANESAGQLRERHRLLTAELIVDPPRPPHREDDSGPSDSRRDARPPRAAPSPGGCLRPRVPGQNHGTGGTGRVGA